MAKKFNARELLIPVIVLLLICNIASGLLASTNAVTADRIAENDAQTRAVSMSLVMPCASYGDEVQLDDMVYSPALDENGGVVGYVFTVTVQGYGGDIDLMCGVNADGTLNRVTILKADDETPGLGQNTKKPAFLDQFGGKSGKLSVVKNAPSADNEIQAVTSATISSTAVTEGVNACLTAYDLYVKGGAVNG